MLPSAVVGGSEAAGENRVRVTLEFSAWQSHLLMLSAEPPIAAVPAVSRVRQLELRNWRLELPGASFEGPLRSWATLGYASFSGTALYRTTFEWDSVASTPMWLELGLVLETARVTLNGVALEPLVWSPYRVEISRELRVGRNELQVEVANTNANALEKRERPSGLLGPVWLLLSEEAPRHDA